MQQLKCEEQGLLKDEFVTDIIDCFEKKNGNIKPLKDKVKELGVTVNVDGMGKIARVCGTNYILPGLISYYLKRINLLHLGMVMIRY